MKLLVVIAGPTAIGKTAFAIAIARHFNTAILSADSRQIFKETNIGTAKPSLQQLNEVTHYFINNRSINEAYNAGKYETEATRLLAELFAEKNIAILCGGSGLYIDAVCKGFDEVPNADDATRKYLTELFTTEGIAALQRMLKEKDPEYFQQVDLNNPQRIMRALEVCLTTQKTYSSFRKATVKARSFEILKIALNTDRAILYERINTRVDAMMNNGLLKEAETLYPFRKNNALQTVGYEELFQHFEAKHTLAKAVSLIKQNTRHYAKRQLTWFNKDKNYHWLQPHELQTAIALIEKILQP